MSGPDLAAVKRRLRALLDPARYAHVLAVADLAAALAVAAGVSPRRAALAALLHDCARSLPPQRLLAILRKYHGRYADAAVRKNPGLWHDPAAAFLARRAFRVRDPGVLRAVARHSTGGARMQPLEKILYVADYSEPRRRLKGLARIRKLAFQDLDAAWQAVAAAKTSWLRRQGVALHPRSLAMLRELGLRRKRGRRRGRKHSSAP